MKMWTFLLSTAVYVFNTHQYIAQQMKIGVLSKRSFAARRKKWPALLCHNRKSSDSGRDWWVGDGKRTHGRLCEAGVVRCRAQCKGRSQRSAVRFNLFSFSMNLFVTRSVHSKWHPLVAISHLNDGHPGKCSTEKCTTPCLGDRRR